ncbi:hypothetical protein GCM10017600_63000 [Streptosporangium carneum]|uniref:Uncharacterized protein n=1 Tax=Streptosporangium carneum TaxID=47481 RepID=A0A9W6I8G9_9ACTN|nr:hypothetical protein GCM10017600_63000 [Streptosporangium carneum]
MASADRFTRTPVPVRAFAVNQSLGKGSRHCAPAIGSHPATACGGRAAEASAEASAGAEFEAAFKEEAKPDPGAGATTGTTGTTGVGVAIADVTASTRLAAIARGRMRLPSGTLPTQSPVTSAVDIRTGRPSIRRDEWVQTDMSRR